MSDQEELPGMGPNPERYRQLSVPFATRDAGSEALNAFLAEVLAARIRHKIPDVLLTIGFSYLGADGEEMTSNGASMFYGDGHKAESLAAIGFATMRAERTAETERLMAEITRRVNGGR